MARLHIGDFSQRTPLTNLMEMAQLTELSQRQNQRAMEDFNYLQDQPLRNAGRKLGIQTTEGTSNALAQVPDYFKNRVGAENQGNLFNQEKSRTALANLPMANQLQQETMGSSLKDLAQKESLRPAKRLEDRLSALDRITSLIDPQIINNPEAFPDDAVEDYYQASGIEIPGYEQLQGHQRRQAISESITARRQAMEAEALRRAQQQAQLHMISTPPQIKGAPFAAVADGKPQMFQSTDRGVVPIPGLSPQTSASNIKTTTRTLPDGSQAEVIFDNNGNELAVIPKGTAKTQKNTLKPSDITKISKLGQNAKLLSEAAAAIEALPDSDLGPVDSRVNKWFGGSPKYNDALQRYNYVINQIRNELFGSALTLNEQQNFEKMASDPTDFSEARFRQNSRGLSNLINEALNSRVKELEQAGYNVPDNLQSNVPRGTNQSGGVLMQAPDGSQAMVPQDKVEEAQQMGAQLVQ